jgi:GNAT superfamily N-acetyltransferase
MSATIRWARPDDADHVVRLVKALAAYEHEPEESVRLSADDVRRDGFGEPPCFEVVLAEWESEVVGFVLFFPNYSTWEGRPGLYIEDLFVEDRARGHGLGRRLMAAVAKIAAARGCRRLDLNVLDWNPTRDFHLRLGGRHLAEWLPYRLDAAAIAALAATADEL